jgi:hypothetical protein
VCSRAFEKRSYALNALEDAKMRRLQIFHAVLWECNASLHRVPLAVQQKIGFWSF